MTAAHNTVVVDGLNHRDAAGKTTLWADGQSFQAVRASAPGLIGGRQFERTVGLVDVSERDFYLVDIFRVLGGSDHAKFVHSHFGEIQTEGLGAAETMEFGRNTQTRNFRVAAKAQPGWSVTWKIEDRMKLLPTNQPVNLRYTDLTAGAEAWTGEAWVMPGIYQGTEGVWNPCVISRRRGAAILAFTFIAVLQAF